MLATILCGVAVAESERNGERRTDANTERAERGQWRKEGPRLFGWTQDGEQIETEANAIRQAVQDVLDGVSLRSIAGAWNDSGLRTPKLKKRGGNEWTNLTLRRVLLNPTHAGHRTYSERKVVDGKDVYEARIVGPGTAEHDRGPRGPQGAGGITHRAVQAQRHGVRTRPSGLGGLPVRGMRRATPRGLHRRAYAVPLPFARHR